MLLKYNNIIICSYGILFKDKKGKMKIDNDIDDNDFDDGGNFDDSKETTGNIFSFMMRNEIESVPLCVKDDGPRRSI